MAEKATQYRKIREVQVRIRTKNAPSNPGEDTQFLVWLEDVSGYFFVWLKGAKDLTMEVELMGLLRGAFFQGKYVKLGYRQRSGGKYITAAWVK